MMNIKSWSIVDVDKHRVAFADGECAEVVRIDRLSKIIYCLSCMAGCPIGCTFCLSGIRYGRKLTMPEMFALLKVAWRKSEKPTLLSMMGSGEPLLCAREIVALFNIVSVNKYAISTSGVGIRHITKFCSVPNLKLQVSVHCVDDHTRQKMIPGSPPLVEIVDAVRQHWLPRPVDWNFVFWKDTNDSVDHADRIVKWAESNQIASIKINAARETPLLVRSPFEATLVQRLSERLVVEYYETDGKDIGAGCGQCS